MADRTGISRHAIMRYEAGKTEPQLEDLQNIALALAIETDKLYDEYYSFLAAPYGKIIRSIRRQHKLRQYDLGKLLGISAGSVKRWESGEHTVTRKMWEQLKAQNLL